MGYASSWKLDYNSVLMLYMHGILGSYILFGLLDGLSLCHYMHFLAPDINFWCEICYRHWVPDSLNLLNLCLGGA